MRFIKGSNFFLLHLPPIIISYYLQFKSLMVPFLIQDLYPCRTHQSRMATGHVGRKYIKMRCFYE